MTLNRHGAAIWLGLVGVVLAGGLILARRAEAFGRHRAPNASGSSQAAVLDRIQRAALDYFLEQYDPQSYLVYNSTEPHAPASITALGAALSAIPVGIERNWLTRTEGYRQALGILKAAARLEHVNGFYYHFFDARTGKRVWNSEVSCIDSAIFFAGAMVAAGYFPGTEVEQRANQLINRAVWAWWLNKEETLAWGWKPEAGFVDGRMQFSESILAYLLALGSSTHPLSPKIWHALRRPLAKATPTSAEMIYTPDGSLFAYLLPHLWFDLREQHDAYADYWTNAAEAIRANLQFCAQQRKQFKTYGQGLWGLSAAIGPDGYKAYGAPPAQRFVHDGTVAPYVVAASYLWSPDKALLTYQRMEQLYPKLWTRYGLGDALNADRKFICPHTIALDQVMALGLIENARSGLLWRLFMQHPVAKRALAAAGFEVGSLQAPRRPAGTPGNPEAQLRVPMMDRAVTVDGDLQEWIMREAFELTPANGRNVEYGFFRNAQDASLLVYAGWTSEMLYFAGIVTDDQWVAHQRGTDIHQDDCLEFFWDLDGEGFRFDGNPHDVQVGLAMPLAEGQPPQVWLWGAFQRAAPEVQAATVQRGQRLFFEVAIPRTLLLGVVPGTAVRSSIAYHDRDAEEQTSKLHWSIDTTSVPGRILFGQMRLEEAR